MQITLEVTPALIAAISTGMDGCTALMDTAPQSRRAAIAHERVVLRELLDTMRGAQAVWEHAELKLVKLNELCETTVKEEYETWMVYCENRYIRHLAYGILTRATGYGKSRVLAIMDDFDYVTNLGPKYIIEIRKVDQPVKHFRWNASQGDWVQLPVE